MEENNFSTFLKELRMEKGLSQEELAKILYVHRTTVNKWESGNVIPLNDKLLLIADFFDVSVDELLNGKRNDFNIVSLERNNSIIELIKSKTRNQKLLIFSVMAILIILLVFLAYYFINNYNSIKLYRVYGENENIRTRDGLLFFSKNKVYFRPGDFYDSNDNIVNVSLIRLYYFDDNDDDIILVTGASKNLIIEKKKSKESFIDMIYKNEKFYMDVCYENSCQKLELNYFNDFNNDDLINNEIKKESAKELNANVNSKDEFIKNLIHDDFIYDASNMRYVKTEDNVVYCYFINSEVIRVMNNNENNLFILKLYLNSKRVIINNKLTNNNIFISDYTNKNDKNYNVFKEYYDKFLSKYFSDFLVV